MAKRVTTTTLNASTIDILNVIRANASLEYQNQVPVVQTEVDIPKVGDILFGTPALANQFINSLVNRIALVRAKSATFNNPYSHLKKGYLEFGETVEEVFVQIAKAREFSVEKAEKREFKRTLPDVRSCMHVMNWKVQYPVTIQREDLRQAFLSMDGVQDMISKIVDSVYRAAEYDEYLLFKALIIKSVAKGQMYPKSIGDGTDLKDAATAFRAASNKITFMKKEYNAAGVTTITPREDQVIFMDSDFNSQFDVEVLSAAFNMDKADFMGRLHLIDDWTTFDNERFDVIRAGSDQIEEVTEEELALMAGVKAVLVDQEWFQIYDNLFLMSETPVSSGLYWNYFLTVWKTVSSSPFSNAIVFVTDGADIDLPDEITGEIVAKDVSENATVLTIDVQPDEVSLVAGNAQFVQTEAAVTGGVAVNKYGSIIYPANANPIVVEIMIYGVSYSSVTDEGTGFRTVGTTDVVGDTIKFVKTSTVG